jgi:hypothetical protein
MVLMPPKTSPGDAHVLDYRPPPQGRRPRGGFGAVALRLVAGYFVVSIVTLPFLDAVWFGELPLLALVQLPKTALAGWLRTDVVMPAIAALGLSRGSFSPDYVMARPYALALAYVPVVLGVVAIMLWTRRRPDRWPRRWGWIALAAAATDFAATLWFAGGPGLTVY